MKNASKGHLKCSHLVVNEPKGSKYSASVKWNIPAVDKEWIFSCAQSGKRLPEENFLIETYSRTVQKPKKETQAPETKQSNNIHISEAVQAPASSKDSHNKKQASEPITSKATPGKKHAPEPTNSKDSHCKEQASEPTNSKDYPAQKPAPVSTISKDYPAQKPAPVSTISKDSHTKKYASVSTSSKGLPADIDADSDEITFKANQQSNSKNQIKSLNEKTNVQSSNDDKVLRSSGEGEEKVPSSSAEEVRSNVVNPMEGIVDRVRSRALQDNQLVNVRQEQTDSPQIKPKHNRLQELKNPNTPGPGTPTMDTPSKFMKPGIDFNPNYSFTDLMKKYQSPENRRDSFDELCSQTLKAAVEKSAIPVDRCPTPLVSRKESILPAIVRPLSGVTIYVSKKLSAKISQFHDIVSELGGDYQWKYTPSCTHVIFQGRANDVNKEFRKARDENKFIVSPPWLQACQEQQVKVQESLFPHNYNPKLSLNVMSKSTPRATPVRPARQAVRSTRTNNSQSTSPKPVPKLNLNNMLSDAFSGTDNKTSSESERDTRKDGDHSKKEKSDSEKDETKNSTDTDRSPVIGRENNKTKSSSGSDSNKDKTSKDVDDKHEEVEKDSGGTLEMRMAISKQLDDMMASAKSKKPAKRKSLKRLNSSGQLNSSDSRPSSRQETWDKNPEKRKTRSTGELQYWRKRS
ncbi:DNA topoisomerase 2-binding protein 1 [Patella vulgata]|uniref:DNA topoisomerase 2-binding protein 1 n=1 Tax=Patella vulgata TaxID=6465 RepID=UPI0024A901BD|nr:DNA topoisomerase 2-binding protein 1 [Patella vulgata]